MRRIILLLVLVSSLAAGLAAARVHSMTTVPFRGYTGDELFLNIPPGTSAPAIGRMLVEAGVVRDELTYRAALWWSGGARELKFGEYRFDRPLTAQEAVDRLRRGDVFLHQVTFPEGLILEEMAERYEASGLGTADAFLASARDPAPLADYAPEAEDLEGYLFPDTYAMPRGTPAASLVRQMVDRFEEAFPPAMREAVAGRGLTVHDAVVLASLVEKETSQDDERPVVAAVYLNRLRIGMPMQGDPTVIYALRKAGLYEDNNLRRDDLSFDSPYNTYRYPGLPPGPIAAPGRASLEAVASPADVSFLYFVSRNDGTHVFANSLAEHNRNVREYQIDYFRRRRQ